MREEGAEEAAVDIGKGGCVKADAKKCAGRDNLLTGGWAGGEVALKNGDALRLKPGGSASIQNPGVLSGFQSGPRKPGTRPQGEWVRAG